MSNSLQSHGLQHTQLPCPSLSPTVCSNSCPLSWWCHPTFSSSVAPFSSCLQSFPASGSFPMSQLFILGSQNIGASASASVLPMSIQVWFPLGLTGLISLLSKELSRVFSSITIQFSSVQSLSHGRLFVTPWIAACQASLSITNSQSLPKLISIESVMPSNHLILCCPLFLLSPIPPSIRVFSNESTLRMSWPKYWSFCRVISWIIRK